VETLTVIRDLAIILLAVLNIVLLAVLVIVAFQVWRLIKIVMREFPGLVNKAKEAATTVEGTTSFLGNTVAKPAINALTFSASARQFISVLARGTRSANRQSEAKR